jgi:peptide chain release factor 2
VSDSDNSPAALGAALDGLAERLAAAREYLGCAELEKSLSRLEVEMAAPDLWADPESAREVTTAYGRAKSDLDLVANLERRLEDGTTLHGLAVEEGPSGFEPAVIEEIRASIDYVGASLDELELRNLYSEDHDERDAVCEIHAGAGGTDAQDWAEMMLRMYLRWAERRGFEVEVEELTPGGEAGILSATFLVRGRYAYGLAKAERGVHRLVRMSPFDAQHRRQTSFASVEAIPFLEDLSGEVNIDDKELRVDTYRSSGAGGQHVNVTDSAVRLTHLPTGIVVSCQNERSQHQNKEKAMQILAAKLVERQAEERRAQLAAISGPQSDVAWGSQIRSYVLAPYQLVKDLRSGYESGNVDAVLDGDVEQFMVAYLRWRRAEEAS